jgi:hypothetical protein
MDATSYQKIISVNGMLQAVVVQQQLEQAGIPAVMAISDNGVSLYVLVPEPCLFDAQNLLIAERCRGEIYFVPARR